MKFADQSICSNPGSPVHVLYAPKVGSNGSVELVKSGIEDTDAYIQSFEESTDIRLVMAQLKAGDTSALNKRPGAYGDFTKAPKTFAEALQLQIDSNRLFDSLPLDVKRQFNNSSSEFFASAGSSEWFDKISPVLPDEVKAAIYPQPAQENIVVKEPSNE